MPRETLTAHDVLLAASDHMKDRATTYDNPEGERSMEKTVKMFNTLTRHHMSIEEGWMFMALLKIVRSQQGQFRQDNYEDLAAYAGLACEQACKARVPQWEGE